MGGGGVRRYREDEWKVWKDAVTTMLQTRVKVSEQKRVSLNRCATLFQNALAPSDSFTLVCNIVVRNRGNTETRPKKAVLRIGVSVRLAGSLILCKAKHCCLPYLLGCGVGR